MGRELAIPPGTLEIVRSNLSTARERLEETASSAPSAIDGGELTSMLTSMLSRVVGSSATVSDSLLAVSAQVAEVDAAFWELDADVARTYSGTGHPR